MKTLDDAVKQFSGKWPSRCGDNVYMSHRPELEGTSYYPFYVTSYKDDDYVYWHSSEFQQRAKELGFINGYRWGIEYATNGKKPELADDVVVCAESPRFNIDELTPDKLSAWNWPFCTKFKITDQRYKPADTSYLVSEISESKQKAENVSVDEIAMAKKEFACLSPMLQDLMQESFDKVIARMEENRKAEAEKKRVVDAAYNAIAKPNGIGVDAALSELYDLGYLRSPTNKD
jgi:hypothetical protein